MFLLFRECCSCEVGGSTEPGNRSPALPPPCIGVLLRAFTRPRDVDMFSPLQQLDMWGSAPIGGAFGGGGIIGSESSAGVGEDARIGWTSVEHLLRDDNDGDQEGQGDDGSGLCQHCLVHHGWEHPRKPRGIPPWRGSARRTARGHQHGHQHGQQHRQQRVHNQSSHSHEPARRDVHGSHKHGRAVHDPSQRIEQRGLSMRPSTAAVASAPQGRSRPSSAGVNVQAAWRERAVVTRPLNRPSGSVTRLQRPVSAAGARKRSVTFADRATVGQQPAKRHSTHTHRGSSLAHGYRLEQPRMVHGS